MATLSIINFSIELNLIVLSYFTKAFLRNLSFLINYRAFHRFEQAKFPSFRLEPIFNTAQLPMKTMLGLKEF